MTVVNVGLASWIIQDGNYGEFQAGGEYTFALEFYPHELEPTAETVDGVSFHLVAGADHWVRGNVVYASSSSWVVDFGVLTFQEEVPPSWAVESQAIAGRIYVGIDPFFYMERLKDEPGMPYLFRRWRVQRILLETTPWIESTTEGGGTLIQRANTTPSFTEVPRTDSWKDDNGRAHYVLECELRGDD